MTWVVRHYGDVHTDDIHHYMGFSSVCGAVKRVDTPRPVQYTTNVKRTCARRCQECQTMLKSRSVHKRTEARRKRLDSAQKRAAKFGVTLQDMMLNVLGADGTGTVKMSEVRAVFGAEFPHVDVEDILLPLVASHMVRLSGDRIVLGSPKEEAVHAR